MSEVKHGETQSSDGTDDLVIESGVAEQIVEKTDGSDGKADGEEVVAHETVSKVGLLVKRNDGSTALGVAIKAIDEQHDLVGWFAHTSVEPIHRLEVI